MPRRQYRRFCAGALALLMSWVVLSLPVACQQLADDRVAPELPFDQWTREGDHQDIAWTIRLLPPRLTYAQRQVVMVTATVDSRRLQRASVQRDLDWLVRITDAAGYPYGDGVYMHYLVKQQMGKREELEFSAAAYVRPGRYNLIIFLYDRVLRQHSVATRSFVVPELKNDPLPALEDGVEAIEFLEPGQVPQLTPSRPNLPLGTTRPLSIDVIVNFAPSTIYTGRRNVTRNNAEVLLEVFSVLAELKPANGCVFLTGLDVPGLKVLFEREYADSLDWDEIRKAVNELNADKVDVTTLAGRKQAADFLRTLLERMFEQPPACGTAAEGAAMPIYLFVGSSMTFPPGTQVTPISPKHACQCRFYQIREMLHTGDMWDEIEKIVRPVRSRRFLVDSPMGLRRALAQIMHDAEGTAETGNAGAPR